MDHKNTLSYEFVLKDANENNINVAGTDFKFRIFRDQDYSELQTINGTIDVDEETVKFHEFVELTRGNYYYRIDWVNDNGTFTIQKGPFQIV